MTDEFHWWRKSLEGDPTHIHADSPQSGYYRKREGKGGPWLPVAIWVHAEQGLVARVGGNMVDPMDVWTWVADKPVRKEHALHAFKHGSWPGDSAPVANQDVGANNPPSEAVDLIPLEVAAADEFLQKVGAIATQLDADIASNKVSNLRGLKTKAELAHKSEKAPYLEAGRLVDAKYKPKIDDADSAVKRLLRAVTDFQNAEIERQRKAAEAKAAIERELHKRQAAVAAELNVPPPPPPAPVEPPKVRSGGALGKPVTLRTVKVATVVEFDVALMALKDHPEMKALVQTLADRACRAGVPLAGVEYSTKQVAQ